MLESATDAKGSSSAERVVISCGVSSRSASHQRAIARRRQLLQRGIAASEFPSSQLHLFRRVKNLIINEREIQS